MVYLQCDDRATGRGGHRSFAMSARRLSATRAAECLYGVANEVCIAGGRLHLAVSKELANHRQTLAEREGAGGEAVSQVVDANIVQVGPLADDGPGVVEVAKPRVRLHAGNHPGVVGQGKIT